MLQYRHDVGFVYRELSKRRNDNLNTKHSLGLDHYLFYIVNNVDNVDNVVLNAVRRFVF